MAIKPGSGWRGHLRLQAGCLILLIALLTSSNGYAQAVYYRFDEPAWTGAVGEVIDRSSNNYHATAFHGPTTTNDSPAIPGTVGTCSYGVFDGVDDYIALPANFPNILTDYSITAWIRTKDRNRTGQRILIDDPNNTAGFGFSLGDGGAGKLRFFSRSTNPVSLDTPAVVANDTWYFVAAVADITNSIKSLYIFDRDGNKVAAVSGSYTGSWGSDTGDASMGGENDVSSEPGPNFRFFGNIDELQVHQGALTEAQIRQVQTSTHLCSPPAAEYSFDSCSETDSVIDMSGNNFTGQVMNGPLEIKTGKICNGAYFDGVDDYVTIDDSNLFDNTSELTIAGWIKPENIRISPAGTNARGIISKRNNASSNVAYGVFFYSSIGDGKLYVDIDTTNNRFATNSVIPENEWSHFAVVFNGNLPAAERVRVYLNGVLDKIAYESSTAIPDYSSDLYIGNLYYGPSELKVYQGMLDEIRVIPQAISAADVQALYNETRQGCSACGGGIDHFRLYHDGAGLTCSPEEIQIRACLDASCSQELSSPETVTLDSGVWLAGDVQTVVSGDILQLWHTTAETVTLGVWGPGHVQNAANPTRCFIGTIEQNSCQLTFYDSGFAFDVPDHTAGTDQNITLAAVRKDDTSGKCVPGLQNVTRDIFFFSTYLDPADGTRSVLLNNGATPGSAPGSPLSLAFDDNGEAHFTCHYGDVGQMKLTASYQGSGQDAGLQMTGSDSFVTRPDHFLVTVSGNPAATNAGEGIFKKAGETFPVEVSAYNAEGDVTPNYGRETTPETVRLTQSLVAPAGGRNPAISGNFQPFGTTCSGSPAAGFACGQFSWPEVGIIDLLPEVGDGDYLGAGNVTGHGSGNVGRFIPDHFAVSILPDPPVFADSCLVFTYLGQPFNWEEVPELTIRAMNAADPSQITQNYEGDFWKLDTTLIYSYIDAGVAAAAAPLTPESVSRIMPDTTSCEGQVTLRLEEDDGISGNGIFDGFNYTRPAFTGTSVPPAPFVPDVTLTIGATELTDADLVCHSGGTGCGDFQVANITGAHLRYGRAIAEAVFGPEISPLVMPVDVYWYDGSAWLPNEDDECTVYSYTLTPAGTSVTSLPPSPVMLSHGASDLTLTPIAGASRGTVTVDCDFPDWLHQDPSAVATFGIARGNDRIINWQEIMR